MFIFGSFRARLIHSVWAMLLLISIQPIKDARPGSAREEYDHALRFFENGRLADCHNEAEKGYLRFDISDHLWATRFLLLDAEALAWRGMYSDSVRILSNFASVTKESEEGVRKLAIEGVIFAHYRQFALADQRLSQAQAVCKKSDFVACGKAIQAHGILAVKQGNIGAAQKYFLEAYSFAQVHQDHFLEANASLNLGWLSLQNGLFDESVEWSNAAYKMSSILDAEDLAQAALGNLGWAYYQLGDGERALERFREAEKSAAKLGDPHSEIKWINNAGVIYHDLRDTPHAVQAYRHALDLAKQIDSQEDIAYALEDLARVSVEIGNLDDAINYLNLLTPMENAGGSRLNANVLLTQGMLAAARHQDQQAEKLLHAIQSNPAAPITTRLGAGGQLARLFEQQGKAHEAEQIYNATLAIFESARAQLQNEDSQLPFAANATDIYNDYIHLLVTQGRSEEALAIADQSRARTLAQGLGVDESKAARLAVLNPRQIAQSSGATLLFYWLGAQHSYLWTITPTKITLTPLPAQKEIDARVERYRRALLDGEDPQSTGDEDGKALYQLLVAPAAKQLRPNAPVMILADGALSQLNFETLLAPGPGSATHYWINDQTLLSAPSLELLAMARPAQGKVHKLLLMGNPVTVSPDFPSLPHFGAEMNQISRHFSARSQAVFAGEQATPAAYLSSYPAQYSYIHFVSHATASRTDPLDSAIILSGSAPGGGPTGENSFKLYARDIMQHPINAQLVIISACNGSGTRAYAGEGLVGLSWAFLRAGAHHVVGALWEVSDDSTPRLMDTLYQGLQNGQAPSTALRSAKLSLLRSKSRFSAPYYWAPFQLYTRR